MEEVSQEWLEKVRVGFQYGVSFNNLLDSDDFSMLHEYPDHSATSVLQFMFDTLDRERLFNDVFFDEFQEILDKWLVEEDDPKDVLQQLRDFWMLTYAGC
jgi:hypothetical protein